MRYSVGVYLYLYLKVTTYRKGFIYGFKIFPFKAIRPFIYADMSYELYSQKNLSYGISYMAIEFASGLFKRATSRGFRGFLVQTVLKLWLSQFQPRASPRAFAPKQLKN